jgi:predicted DNA-binding transcriptional regulator AlpA
MPRPRRAESADDILTSPTAARLAGLDRVHFARLIREGKGPRHQTIKAGERHLVLILRRDLDAWVAARNA